MEPEEWAGSQGWLVEQEKVGPGKLVCGPVKLLGQVPVQLVRVQLTLGCAVAVASSSSAGGKELEIG